MKKSITFEKWIEIATSLFAEVQKAVADDGRISVVEAIGLLITFLNAVNKAVKDSE